MSAQRYLVSARKYRPQVFSELVAQEHVADTLKNAIRLDRLAHAYLFSGPRGVGKTTAARILAKAINCTTPLDQREAGAEPCRECDSCRSFEQGRSLNIIEIDAASNNRVDDIRDLRDTVRIPPQGGRKKVYIVDEVHMLTAQAFNALLKTLEEPPPYVLFIFATTEPHKVLPTILSRCQRFDFRRISVPEIVVRLEDICRQEGITADEASLLLIARKGDGALRDALSVFDQAVSLCGNNLVYAELAQALGVVDVDLYFEVTEYIAGRDSAGMLRLVERIVRSGHDLQEFVVGLAEHLRNLLVARTTGETSLIEAAESTRTRYAKLAARFTEADLLRLLTLAADAEEKIKESQQPRLKLETVLLQMASLTLAADLREAIQKIERLESMAREGALPSESSPRRAGSPAPSANPDPPSPDQQRTNRPSNSSGNQPPGLVSNPPTYSSIDSPSNRATDSRTNRVTDPAPAKTSNSSTNGGANSPTISSDGLTSPGTDTPVAPEMQTGVTRELEAATTVLGTPALKRRAAVAGASNRDMETDVAVADEPSDGGPIAQVWEELLGRIRKDKIQVWSILHLARPEGYVDGIGRIAVPKDFHRRVLTGQEAYVLEHLRPMVGVPVRSLQFVVREEMEASDAEETAQEFDPYEYMQRKRQDDPVIRAIFDQFGGEPVW